MPQMLFTIKFTLLERHFNARCARKSQIKASGLNFQCDLRFVRVCKIWVNKKRIDRGGISLAKSPLQRLFFNDLIQIK